MQNRKFAPRFAAALLLTLLFVLQSGAALAAPPADSVNLGYDLEVTSDWSAGEGNSLIAPAGETILFAANWHRGSDASEEWAHASHIAYEWRSSDKDVVSEIRQVASWYEDQPNWDPEVQVPGSYAQAATSYDNLGTSQITCTATALSPYMLTGKSQASLAVNVVGLTAVPVAEFIPAGRSVMLDAYWTPGEEWSKDEARQFFLDQKADLELWGGSSDKWTVTRLVTPSGAEITSPQELQAAAGSIRQIEGVFGCTATVAPTRPGTYTFTCVPSVGTAAAEVEVRIVHGNSMPSIVDSSPAGSKVLVSPVTDPAVLRQRFSVATMPGYDSSGKENAALVYWSVRAGYPSFDTGGFAREAEAGTDEFIRGTSGALYTGEAYTLRITEELLDYTSSAVRAWVVPEAAGVSEEAITAYGRQHPDCVREWTLQDVTGPVILPVDGSDLAVSTADGQTIINGISATPQGSVLPKEAMANFYWNAGSQTRITDADRMQLPEDRNVGTGCVLSILFPDNNNIRGTYGTFVVKGDVTGSGTVTLTDVVRMARAMNNPAELTGVYLRAGDFTGTGSITLTDVVNEAKLFRGM